jgi:hypothetical protein
MGESVYVGPKWVMLFAHLLTETIVTSGRAHPVLLPRVTLLRAELRH